MNEMKTPELLNRRRFLLVVLVAGSAAAAGLSLLRLGGKKPANFAFDENTVLFRNPAFRQQKSTEGIVVSTTTREGKRLRLRMDVSAAYLWENTATMPQFREGKSTTVGQLINLAVNRFKERDASLVKKEAWAFLKEAVTAGVILGTGQKVYEPFQPRMPKK